jgi:hypothetical protein
MAEPFMRPAWDSQQGTMIEILKRELWAEIEKAVERAARRAGS